MKAGVRSWIAGISTLVIACAPESQGSHRPTHAVVEILADSTQSVRARTEAAFVLGQRLDQEPQNKEAIEALLLGLADPREEVRVAAGSALARNDARASLALPRLFELLRDSSNAQLREEAAFLIGMIGSLSGDSSINALRASLHDPDASVRATAAEALGMIGVGGMETLSDLAIHSADPSAVARQKVIEAMRNLEADPALMIPVLRQAMRDSSASVRRAAAFLAGTLAERAVPLIDVLVDVVANDSAAPVRRAAALSLAGLGDSSRLAIQALEEARTRADGAQRDRLREALRLLREENTR